MNSRVLVTVLGAGAAVLLMPAALSAEETIDYQYDALGRLIGSQRSGTVNNGVNTQIAYDDADNRGTYVVTGVSSPGPPSFSVTGGSANEGSPIVFTISRSNSTAGTFSVNYATSNGTATASSDYTPKSGTMTFNSAQSQTVNVTTILDSAAESAETVVLTLSNPTGGATIQGGAGQANGTINANAGNTAPTAVNDSFTIPRCTAGSFNLVANDTDFEGNYPLVLTQIAGQAWQLGASISGTTSVSWPAMSIATTYSTLSYTVADSLGATSSGYFSVTITSGGGSC